MRIKIALFFVLLTTMLGAYESIALNLPAKVSVSLETRFENQPIVVKIQIIRLAYQKVDTSSFALNGKPLQVTYVGEEKPQGAPSTKDADALVVSVYSATLTPQSRGLYVLPVISVKVGDTTVSSSSISYEIVGSKVSDELSLTARMIEPGPVFPGQKVTFEYQISFRKPIQLTKEELPLLNLEGFRNIGAPVITNGTDGANSVQIIRQKAISETVGVFHSGPSIIEGYVYYLDAEQNPRQISEIYHAEAPDVAVTVLAFPAPGQPSSFNGAIGVFLWQARVIGPTTVSVGEKISLELFVSGSGDLESVQVPDLSIQGPFKNMFVFGDLAPLGQVKEGTKRFVIELRPISDKVKEVPSIECASFDPISKTYVVKKTAPIPITVRPGSKREEFPVVDVNASTPIEIQKNVILDDSELETKDLESILLVYAAFAIAFALGLQLILRRLFIEGQEKKDKSRELFLEAIKKRSEPDAACRLLTKALLLVLFEQGITKELISHPEQLKNEGLEAEVRKLLVSINQKRFTGIQAQEEMNECINYATQIYHRLTRV